MKAQKERHYAEARAYPIGTKVVAYDHSRLARSWHGVVVGNYYTLNGWFRNYSYLVLCDDGKERSVNRLKRRR